jgi:hypothetical protein
VKFQWRFRLANDGSIPLEDGIEVKFEEGTYKTGDYWLIRRVP